MLKEFFLIILAFAFANAHSTYYYTELTADKEFLLKQKKIYQLLYHVNEATVVNPELYKEGRAYCIDGNRESYTNKTIVRDFLERFKLGLMPKSTIFNLYYPEHLEEARSLFKLFYSAKNFNAFYKTALWARVHVNPGEFFFVLYQAVIRRPDTVFIQLPQLYELNPYAFFNSDVINAAKNLKLGNKLVKNHWYTIHGNYSTWSPDSRDHDSEMKLTYFTEDVGLSFYYYLLRLDNPFWLSGDEFSNIGKEWRGEEYLHVHRQLLNRYNLERLANGLEKIEDFTWGHEFYPGYYPAMVYHNGLPVPQRPSWSKIPHYKYEFLHQIHDIEGRISAAIDLGYVIDADGSQHKIYTPEGLNLLGNIIEGNVDSCNKDFYGNIDALGRRVLGFSLEPKNKYRILPSPLESFSSCLRDPAFYRLYQKLMHYYYRYKARMGPYSRDEIIHPDLKFQTVTVDKLITYFDDFDSRIDFDLPVVDQNDADNFVIKFRQQRLNHQRFTVHIGLHSNKAQKVAIRLFLGPKLDAHHKPLHFTENYKDFYEIDYWVTDVKRGLNKLHRNSHDFFFLMPDKESGGLFYQRILRALNGTEKFKYRANIYGFPERLLLPKGSPAGSVHQLFVYVSPLTNQITHESRVFGNYVSDDKPMGFPLDRPINHQNFKGSNVFFKDVLIYSKH